MTELAGWLAGYRFIGYQALICLRRQSYRALLRALRALIVTVWTDLLGLARTDVECPYCGWRGYQFRPIYYYDHFRENVCCPSCGALERHRLLFLFLRDKFSQWAGEGMVALDIGPIREMLRALPPKCFYVPFDLCSPLAKVRGNLTKAPFKDGVFDFACCYHVLEHISDDRAAMQELHRVMKKDAWGIFQVPLDDETEATLEYGGPNEAEAGHVRLYGLDYQTRLEKAGFIVERNGYFFTLSAGAVSRYGLSAEYLYCVRKVGG